MLIHTTSIKTTVNMGLILFFYFFYLSFNLTVRGSHFFWISVVPLDTSMLLLPNFLWRIETFPTWIKTHHKIYFINMGSLIIYMGHWCLHPDDCHLRLNFVFNYSMDVVYNIAWLLLSCFSPTLSQSSCQPP